MTAKLPNGAKVFLATQYAGAKKITELTNAFPAVATCTAHGLSSGDFIELSSGWGNLNDCIMKVEKVDENKFKLLKVNTTNLAVFPVGAGIGSFRNITAETEIQQILEFNTSGGEQQYTNFIFLDEAFERQLPTYRSAMTLNIGIADDPNMAGYQAAEQASDEGGNRALFVKIKGGEVIAFNTIVSMSKIPTMNVNSVMQSNISFAISGLPIRY